MDLVEFEDSIGILVHVRRGQLRRQAAAALRLRQIYHVKDLTAVYFLFWNWSTRRRPTRSHKQQFFALRLC